MGNASSIKSLSRWGRRHQSSKARLSFMLGRVMASTRRLLAIVMFSCGILICAYAAYMPAKAALAQVLLQRAWTQVQNGSDSKPWPWADFTPVARVGFPTLKTSVIVVSDGSGEALAFGPTHLIASADFGANGTSVVAAHRDTHFRQLGQLSIGDKVTIETPDARLIYQITHKEVVLWNASGIQPRDGGFPRIALVTCWPVDGAFQGDERLIVWGKQVASIPITERKPT